VAEVGAAVTDGGASEEEVARWWRHCIYHVPACIKDLNPKAYRPQVVSLGPFHHLSAPPDDVIRSAEELYEAGVRFKRSATGSLLDIRFHRGTLYLPPIAVDDTT